MLAMNDAIFGNHLLQAKTINNLNELENTDS